MRFVDSVLLKIHKINGMNGLENRNFVLRELKKMFFLHFEIDFSFA